MSKFKQLTNIVLLEFLKKFSGDIYIIALPAIAASLNTERKHVQIMVSLFLIGVAISQFFGGPLSDIIGRRKILLTLLVFFIIGAFVCATGPNIVFLFSGIFIMGLGIGTAPVIGKAIIFDLFHKTGRVATFLAITSAFVVWAPAIAMAIGGNVAHYFGWEFIFIVSGIFGVIVWFITYFILNAHAPNHKKAPTIANLLKQYLSVISHPLFCISLLGLGLIAGGIFVFYTSGFFIFNHTLKLPLNIIGYFSFLIVGGNFLGKFVAVHFEKKVNPVFFLLTSCSIALVSMLVLFVLSICHDVHVYTILLPMMVYAVGLGSLMPIARTFLMYLKPKSAGTASGLTGIVIALTASLLTYVVSHFHIETALPMATLLLCTSLLAWLLFFFSVLLRPNKAS